MQSAPQAAPASKTRSLAGHILSSLAVLFLLFDSVIKLMKVARVVESFDHLGYPARLVFGIGVLELACIAAYVIPRTSVLGAILLTGFLGGATATQVRIGEPLFSHVLFPTYIGLLVWGGLFLREGRLRALVPLRNEPAPASVPPTRESAPRAELAELRS